MKLVALPDLHERIENLDRIGQVLRRADYVLLPGDLANGNGVRGAARVIEQVKKFNPNVLAIPGNWDDPATCALMTRQGINLHQRAVVYHGVAFVGAGGALSSHSTTLNEVREEKLARDLQMAVAGLDVSVPLVLMCHQPPFNTRADLAHSKKHVGSRAVRDFIERFQPRICFTGHIHEAAGIDRIGETLIVNPGPLWEGWYGTVDIHAESVHAQFHRLLPAGLMD